MSTKETSKPCDVGILEGDLIKRQEIRRNILTAIGIKISFSQEIF